MKYQDELPSIKGFTFSHFLAAGGMGKVFVAHDHKREKNVAIKLIHAQLTDAINTQRFLREIEIMKQLSHPNIVSVYESGTSDDGQLYMVMPLVHGEDLNNFMKHDQKLKLRATLVIIKEIAKGLSYAHKKGVTHRDIKPHNILLDEKTKKIYISDFGLAKALDSPQLTKTRMVLGSATFISPEQITGKKQTTKSDVYSLGALLFKLITGENIYQGSNPIEVMTQHIKKKVPDLPTSHKRLQPLLEHMCTKDPVARLSAQAVLLITRELLADPNIE